MNNGQDIISSKYGTIDSQLKWLDKHNHPCLDAIRESLKELKQLKNDRPVVFRGTVSMVRVLDVVSRYYQVHPNQIISPGRNKGKVNEALQMGMYLCDLHTTASPGQVCKQFNRDHTMMSYVRSRMRDLISVYPEFRQKVKKLEDELFWDE